MASRVKLKRDSIDLPSSRRIKRGVSIPDQLDDEIDHRRPDRWLSEEPGEEYRYARGQRTLTPAQAYQQSAALKEQRTVHRPFYFEELGQEPETLQSKAPPQTQPVTPQVMSYQQPTRFYPHTGDDAIAPIGRVRPAQLQRVLPSYELSTEETRETGLGPILERGVYPRRSPRDES